jgi:hypothetical protein
VLIRAQGGVRPRVRVHDLLERQVAEVAVVGDVLHVLATGRVEGVQQRVLRPVELQRRDPEARAQLLVERGAGLAPLPLHVQQRVAVVDEEVGPHDGTKAVGLQVVADVGEPEPRRDPSRASRGGQRDGLRDAVRRALGEHGARAVVPGVT